MSMDSETQGVFCLRISGVLRNDDVRACQYRMAEELKRHRTVKLLFLLDGFEGWEVNQKWTDLAFYATYGDRIDRIAIVGPPRWKSEALIFALAELRRAPVQFFPSSPGATASARAWLTRDVSWPRATEDPTHDARQT